MKKILIIALALGAFGLGFGQKSKKTDGYEITVKVNNCKDTSLYLAYHLGNKKYVKDTAQIDKKGNYVFSGSEELPGGIYIIFFDNKQNFEIIVDEQKFSIETDTNNFVETFKSENTVQNKIFYDFLKFSSAVSKKAMPVSKDRTAIMDQLKDEDKKLNKKEREALTTEKNALEDQIRGFEKEIRDYRLNIFKEHEGLFVTKTLKAVDEPKVPKEVPDSLKFNYYKAHYFDNIDLSDDRMMRTPILHTKIMKFIEKMTLQIPDSVKSSADYMLSKTKPNSEMFRYITITITNKYGKSKIMGMDAVFVHMIDNYYNTGKAFWADSADMKRLGDRAQTLKWTLIGNSTPNLLLKDTNDVYKQVYQVQAPYMILYFWDPDCGHCKKVTPKLVKAYNEELKAKGIKVFAITTTTNKKKWIDGIHKMKMADFINTYDPEHKTGFRQLYDITSTPKVFVVDEQKKIIAKQLGVDQLADFFIQYEKIEKLNKK